MLPPLTRSHVSSRRQREAGPRLPSPSRERHGAHLIGCVLAGLLVTTTAHAQDATAPAAASPTSPSGEPPPSNVPKAWQATRPPKMVKDSYSGYILLSDTLAFSGVLLTVATGSLRPLYAAGGIYLLGGPIVHSTQKRFRTAGASLGLRVVAPVVSAAITGGLFAVIGRNDASSDGGVTATDVGVGLGLGIGFVAAPILDAAILARREWFDDLEMVPEVASVPGGATFGLRGTF